jgi:hypothetical protein
MSAAMRRAFILVPPLALLAAACGGGDADRGAAPPPSAEQDRIDCAVGGGPMERACTVETSEGEAGTLLTLRKPDGGFRRVRLADDGRGVVAADGAEPAEVAIVGDNRIEVTIGGDRFRLPATVRPR